MTSETGEKTMVNTWSESQHMAFFPTLDSQKSHMWCNRYVSDITFRWMGQYALAYISIKSALCRSCRAKRAVYYFVLLTTSANKRSTHTITHCQESTFLNAGKQGCCDLWGHLSGRPYLMTRESERFLQRVGEVTSFVIWVKKFRAGILIWSEVGFKTAWPSFPY